MIAAILFATELTSSSVAPSATYFECSLRLASPMDASLTQNVGLLPLRMTFLREPQERKDKWQAWGHANLLIHRAADQPFPVIAADGVNEVRLTWRIHEATADGTIAWNSADRTSGEIQLNITDAFFHAATYVMSGHCQGKKWPFDAAVSKAWK